MPHFGLMSTKESFESAEGALQRARLHIRGGRRRLREGKISAGIVTLYDALLFALRFYFMLPEHRAEFGIDDKIDLTDERLMLKMFRERCRAVSPFDMEEFEDLVDQASENNMGDFDYRPLLNKFEGLMADLEVMPFDESMLPAEDPATF